MKNLLISRSENRILKSFSDAEFKEISHLLERVEFFPGTVIYSSEQEIEFVYFPENMVASVVINLENGSSVETAIIGKDGVIGAEVVLSDDKAQREVNVQLGGGSFRMRVENFRSEFEERNFFRRQILLFVGRYLSQVSQNSACLSFHDIEQRLCRWLLMFHDRAETNEFRLTQELIATVLGVHRPSVSKNANKLQRKGFISYNRGKITILDRDGLENGSCECYRGFQQI